MLEVIGFIGAFCFAVCAVPQAYESWKQGHSRGISSLFLWLWITGEVCMVLYTLPLMKAPLLINYIGNLLLLTIIIYYKYYERQNY